MWQDYAIAFGQVVMSASLIPMVLHKEKPPFLASIPTAVCCAVFSFTFGTLGLWFSVASSGAAGILWFTLVFQKMKTPPSPQK